MWLNNCPQSESGVRRRRNAEIEKQQRNADRCARNIDPLTEEWLILNTDYFSFMQSGEHGTNVMTN